MLRQKQRLVEVLKMQLELGKGGGRALEPLVLVKVKQEPPDKSIIPLSFVHPPLPRPPSSCQMGVSMVTIKQEVVKPGEVLFKIPNQEAQMKSEQKKTQKKQEHICLQQASLQFIQQETIKKLLLQRQGNRQNEQRTSQNCSPKVKHLQNLQNRSQPGKKKSHKRQLNHQEQQQEKQIPLNQQKSLLQQQNKQQHQIQQQQEQIQLHATIPLIQQKQKAPQVSHAFYNIIYSIYN